MFAGIGLAGDHETDFGKTAWVPCFRGYHPMVLDGPKRGPVFNCLMFKKGPSFCIPMAFHLLGAAALFPASRGAESLTEGRGAPVQGWAGLRNRWLGYSVKLVSIC